MSPEPVRIADPIRFGDDFELDLRSYELRRAGKALKLERLPMELLVLLVERRGELVTRDQIAERIWGRDVFVDTGNSINAAIRKIRLVLKDDPDRPRFLVTVTGKGYRFVAPVEEPTVPAPTAQAPAELPESFLGKKVSNYRIVQLLGGGGMGVVYKAEDLKLGRQVALKFLPSELASDPNAFERLQREARAASLLDHPNICPVYQLGDHEGQPFIVMQFLEGQTLREWIQNSAALDAQARLGQLLDIAMQILSGLQAAHDGGIIHRDIKPANIFITTRNQVKILDFGVAKFVDSEQAENRKSPVLVESEPFQRADPFLTRTGASMGTPSYLSPEQIRREELDARTDLFSFGLVLYEMATGERAFAGSTATMIRDAVLTQPAPAARQLSPSLPPVLEKVISKALEKNPANRYQSAKEMQGDLAGLQLERQTAPSHRRRTMLWASAGVAALVLLLVGFNADAFRSRFLRSTSTPDSESTVRARPSIAVLGFKNLSGKDDEAWISTAVSELLNAELASGERLRVVPSEDVARMKVDLSLPIADTYGRDTLAKVRNQLSSDMVVLGSYLATGKDSGGKIRINLQLQDAKEGESIAVVSRDGSEADLADLASQVGASLRQKLGIGDISATDARHVLASVPANLDAARYYSEGLAKLQQFEMLSCRDFMQKAIAADPNHALSHATLAECFSWLGYDQKAQEEAKRALALSTTLSREDQLSIEGRYGMTLHEWKRAVDVYHTLWGFFPDNLDYGLALSKAQVLAGLPKDALITIQALANNPAFGSDPRVEMAEAMAADKSGDLRREVAAAGRAVEKGQRLGARIMVAHALLTHGTALSALGDSANAILLLKQAQETFSAVGDQQGVARALNDLGIIQRQQANLSEARKLLEQALAIARQTGSKGSTLMILNNLGNVLWDGGDLPGTLKAQQESLQLSREVGDRANESSALNNMAGVLTQEGNLPEARKMYDSSLQLANDIGDQEGAGLALGNIADLLTRQGDLTQARQTDEKALAIDRQVGDKSYEGYALHQLGSILVSQGDTAGRPTLQDAVVLRHSLGEKVTEGESQLSLAQLELDTGDAKVAEAEARRLVAVFHEGSATDDECLSDSVLALALMRQERFSEAQQAIAASKALLAKAIDIATHMQVEIADAYVAGMSFPSANPGQVASAVRALGSIREKAARLGYVGLELEARLRLGEIQLRSQNATLGKAALRQLGEDARARGFVLISRKAKSASEEQVAHR